MDGRREHQKREGERAPSCLRLKRLPQSQVPQKFVNLSFTITSVKSYLTDLCRNSLLQNDVENTLCEIKEDVGLRLRVFRCRVNDLELGASGVGEGESKGFGRTETLLSTL